MKDAKKFEAYKNRALSIIRSRNQWFSTAHEIDEDEYFWLAELLYEEYEAGCKEYSRNGKYFPSPDGPPFPWYIAEKAYAKYVELYGRGQSLETLAQRGGFYQQELDALTPGWRNEVSELEVLKKEKASLEATIDDLRARLDTSICSWDHTEMDMYRDILSQIKELAETGLGGKK